MATDLFRTHVQRSPQCHALTSQTASIRIVVQLSQTKVSNFDLTCPGHQNVFWLDVSVNNARLTRRFQSRCNLANHQQRRTQIRHFLCLQNGSKVLTFHQFLSNKMQTVFFANRVNLHDTGMIQTSSHHGFLLKPSQHHIARRRH